MDPVVKNIRDIDARDENEFAQRFAQQFLEKRGFVRTGKVIVDGKEVDQRQIQPLFGWLLMESHALIDKKEIEVAPGVTAKPTAGPLLIELGKAVFQLHAKLKQKTPALADVINAHTAVQRLSQETMMRVVAGAQIMATLVAYKASGNRIEELQFSFALGQRGSLLADDINKNIMTKLGIRDITHARKTVKFDAVDRRAFYALDSVGAAVKDQNDPYVSLKVWQQGIKGKYWGVALEEAGEDAKKITSIVDQDADDYVTVQVDWQ